jgi:hypothetical protein
LAFNSGLAALAGAFAGVFEGTFAGAFAGTFTACFWAGLAAGFVATFFGAGAAFFFAGLSVTRAAAFRFGATFGVDGFRATGFFLALAAFAAGFFAGI